MKTELSFCRACGKRYALRPGTVRVCSCGAIVHAGYKPARYWWDMLFFALVVLAVGGTIIALVVRFLL
jgi:hypothetical protein